MADIRSDVTYLDDQEVSSKDFNRKLGIEYPGRFSESAVGVGLGLFGVIIAVVIMMGFGR